MKEVKAFNCIVGEEVGTKVKAFLIAPTDVTVRVGDLVEARTTGGVLYADNRKVREPQTTMRFRSLYVDQYCPDDGTVMTVLHVALGRPLKVTSVIREEPIKWGDDSDDVDG